MSQVTYSLDLIPENAPKIDAINRIMLGDSYTAQSASAPAKKADQAIAADNQKSTSQGATETSIATTLEQLKSAAKKAKKDHGEEFAMQTMKDLGVKVASSLGRSMSAVATEQYDEVIAAWVEGPLTEAASDELEDDGFGDEDGLEEDTSEVTAEAVKTALKAYSKSVGRDEAKAIMTEHGAAALSKVDDCTPAELQAMFKKLV